MKSKNNQYYRSWARMMNCSGSSTQKLYSTIPETAKPYKSMPGLSSIPFLGPLHHFLPVIGEIGPSGQLFDKFGQMHAKYGPVMKMDGVLSRGSFAILFEPEHFEQVYRSEEENPLRPGFQTLTYYREELRKSTYEGTYGLTTAQGPQWRDFRMKVNPALLKPKLVKLYASALDELADEMVERLDRLKDVEGYLDKNFELELTKWSLESIALVCLGDRLGCLRDDLPEDHPAQALIKCGRDIIDFAFELEFLPSLWRYYQTPTFKRAVATYDKQWEISKMYIDAAKKRLSERTEEVLEEDKSILEKLLAIDEKVAVMMANEMLFAGIDTVMFATICLLYRLAINPRVQDKLREEIRSEEANNRYVRACLKESLRIWHIVPGNLRRSSKDHYVGGYHIPPGVDVIAPNQYLSSLDCYFPRAKEFIPERWLVDKSDPLYHRNAHPMINLPFGFGVRSCIGRRIAEMEIEILVKKLVDKYQITWTGPPAKVYTKLMNSFGKPFHFKFERVK